MSNDLVKKFYDWYEETGSFEGPEEISLASFKLALSLKGFNSIKFSDFFDILKYAFKYYKATVKWRTKAEGAISEARRWKKMYEDAMNELEMHELKQWC